MIFISFVFRNIAVPDHPLEELEKSLVISILCFFFKKKRPKLGEAQRPKIFDFDAWISDVATRLQ
jgi:hypothetical protein